MASDRPLPRPAVSPVGGRMGLPPRPLPPLFTAHSNRTEGTVSTRGHLDRIGAEALCRTVTALQQLGHRRIVVLPGPAATVDDDARTVLAEQARRLRANGVRLVLG